jgi:MoaA/NifB/PqqE/SkfB family radical SAM enzyme
MPQGGSPVLQAVECAVFYIYSHEHQTLCQHFEQLGWNVTKQVLRKSPGSGIKRFDVTLNGPHHSHVSHLIKRTIRGRYERMVGALNLMKVAGRCPTNLAGYEYEPKSSDFIVGCHYKRLMEAREGF